MSITLWHPRPREKRMRDIKPGDHLYSDLVHVIGTCLDRRDMVIARVECPPEFLRPHNDGIWFSAIYPIRIQRFYSPKSAESEYLS